MIVFLLRLYLPTFGLWISSSALAWILAKVLANFLTDGNMGKTSSSMTSRLIKSTLALSLGRWWGGVGSIVFALSTSTGIENLFLGAKNFTVSGETTFWTPTTVCGRFSNRVSIVFRSYILAVSESSLNDKLAGGFVDVELGLRLELSSVDNSTDDSSCSSSTDSSFGGGSREVSSSKTGVARKTSSAGSCEVGELSEVIWESIEYWLKCWSRQEFETLINFSYKWM